MPEVSSHATRLTKPIAASSHLPIAMDISEACQLIGLSRTTLYREIDRGAIESRKSGRRRLILTKSLEDYVNRLSPI